jgi:hypothetical protein
MSLGALAVDIEPILRRELSVAARSGTIGLRAGSVPLVVMVILGVGVAWRVAGRDGTSIAGASALAQTTFGCVVAMQALLTLMIVPEEVARILVGARQRKTLDGLLASGLSSAEIVLGVLAAGLVRWASCLAAALPVVLIMSPLLGLDLRLLLLSYAGLGTTALALGAISVVVSIGAGSRRGALFGIVSLAYLWLFIPLLALIVLSVFWPAARRIVTPVAGELLASSPAWMLGVLIGFPGRGGLIAATTRMMVYETAGASLLLGWAIARFRPACRARAERQDRAFFLQRRRRPPRHRVCGSDPMFWKEVHATPRRGFHEAGGLLIPILAGVALLALLFARPAFLELFARGYGASPGDASQPSSFFEWAFVLARGTSAAPGQARALFNLVLRDVTFFFCILGLLLTAETAAKSVGDERAQNTWPGLLATPLPAVTILRANVLGAVWALRGLFVLEIGLWSTGLAAGAVHPLGYVASLVLLIVSTVFTAVVGMALSLRSDDSKPAVDRTVLVLVLLTFSGLLPRLLPPASASLLMGAGSIPLVSWLALLSYNDVAGALAGERWRMLDPLAIETGEGAHAVVATYLIGLAVLATAAAIVFRGAVRGFDSMNGRPAERPFLRQMSMVDCKAAPRAR